MLRLITREVLSSALTTNPRETLLLGVERVLTLDLVRGLRPWKVTLDGFRRWVWDFWMVGDKAGADIMDEAEAAIFGLVN